MSAVMALQGLRHFGTGDPSVATLRRKILKCFRVDLLCNAYKFKVEGVRWWTLAIQGFVCPKP